MPTPKPYTALSGVVTWRVRFRLDGRSCSETFETERAAQRFATDLRNHDPATALQLRYTEDEMRDRLTLDEWSERHFNSLTGVTPGTLVTYRRVYARCWHPTLGSLPLAEVNRERIAKAMNQIQGADKTVKNAHGILSSMLKMAVLDGHIPRNPAAGIPLPRRTDHEATEHRYLTLEELGRLIDALPAYWRPLVLTLAGTGMRWGELEALTVRDIDVHSGVVRVTKAVKWDSSLSTRQVGPTKTKKSRRTITLPPEVIEAVLPLLDRPGSERLFVAPRGGPLRHRTFWHDIWRPAVKRAGIEPPPRIHDMRHSAVAWLIGAGISLPVIQARLGHESIKTTVDTYGHLLPDLQRQAADAASAVLSGLTRPLLAGSPTPR